MNNNELYTIEFSYYEASTCTIYTTDRNTAFDIVFILLRNNLYTLDLHDPDGECILTWNREYGFGNDD